MALNPDLYSDLARECNTMNYNYPELVANGNRISEIRSKFMLSGSELLKAVYRNAIKADSIKLCGYEKDSNSYTFVEGTILKQVGLRIIRVVIT